MVLNMMLTSPSGDHDLLSEVRFEVVHQDVLGNNVVEGQTRQINLKEA